jgi:hypothetical protein
LPPAPSRRTGWLPWVAGAVALVLVAAISSVTTAALVHGRTQYIFATSVVPGARPSQQAATSEGFERAEREDLLTASIAEESYATDHNGAYVADDLGQGASPSDPLVQQGLRLSGRDRLVAALFTTQQPDDSFCLVATSADTPAIWYLSSVDNVPTRVKAVGCPAS